MSTRVSGNVKGLHGLRAKLQAVPATAALATARQAAPALTTLAGGSYDAGQTVYGSSRPKGKRGQRLSLVASGTTRRLIKFVSDGTTTIRAALAEKYMRYLVGKYGILPSGARAALPRSWQQRIDGIATRECGEAAWKELGA